MTTLTEAVVTAAPRMLTTKQAWLEIAEAFERYGKTKENSSGLTYSGLCYAVSSLCAQGRITWAQSKVMQRQLQDFGPHDEFGFPPDGFWFAETKRGIAGRVAFAALMAEVAEDTP